MRNPVCRFACRLALMLGRTVGELLRSMTYREWCLWLEFERVEPFGPLADDMRHAQVAAVVWNANRGRAPARGLRDFLLSRTSSGGVSPEEWWEQYAPQLRRAMSERGDAEHGD